MLPQAIRGAAERFGDRAAYVAASGEQLTYAELHRRSDEVAVGLLDAGVGEGDVVALTGPSDAEYIVAYLAAAKVGAITAGVNPRYTPTERQAVLDVAMPAVVLDGGDAEALRRPGHAPPEIDENPERLVAIVFTSGTTGTPKGAMFGNRELLQIARADVSNYDDDASWGSGGAMLAATAFAHIGSMTKLLWYLRLGTTTYLLERWRSADVLALISEHRLSNVGGVAPQVALLLRDPSFDDHDFSSVRTIVMGGALSPPALVAEARERFGAAYSIRYSSTESGGVGTGTGFDADDEEALFTVGSPRGDVEIEIRAEDDHPVAPGETGEVCLRSSSMMRGYWRDPEATAVTLRGGWLHTGDLGRVDDRGLLRLAGRAKEMFVRGGYNVYPLEVEAVLATHPQVVEVAVVPRPDPVMGEVGVAVVVPRDPDAPPRLDELRRFAGARLAAFKLPEAVRLVDRLPLTAMQKVDRRALTAREQEAGPEGPRERAD